jgi:release factor glutamine methyltransferase
VSPDVLIPRPETEEIVNWILHNFTFHLSPFTILDLCTGSGCIAIALKKAFPAADVTAVDISPAALEIALENAKNNGADIRFMQTDVLNGVDGLSGAYGLIVSNPPYVRDSERAQMQRNVLDYDPALALFVPDNDPLRFYKAIAAIAKEHLAKDGMLVVEINEALADETCTLLKDEDFSPTLHTDFRGKSRWVSAVWNP